MYITKQQKNKKKRISFRGCQARWWIPPVRDVCETHKCKVLIRCSVRSVGQRTVLGCDGYKLITFFFCPVICGGFAWKIKANFVIAVLVSIVRWFFSRSFFVFLFFFDFLFAQKRQIIFEYYVWFAYKYTGTIISFCLLTHAVMPKFNHSHYGN